MQVMNHFMIWVLTLCFIFKSVHALHNHGSYQKKYSNGDIIQTRVSSLTSIETQIPISYYTLPFCKPLEGIDHVARYFSQLDRIENSPYVFKMNMNESDIFLCQSQPLSADDVSIFKKRIDEMYQVNLFLDNMPAIRGTGLRDGVRITWQGYPVGVRVRDSYYVLNHLKLTVLVHKVEKVNVGTDRAGLPKYEVVGFEVAPCGFRHNVQVTESLKMYEKYPVPIKCDPYNVGKEVKEHEPVAFTYEVVFKESHIKWTSTWDVLLESDNRVHWFSISKSVVTILLLSCVILCIIYEIVSQNRNQYDAIGENSSNSMLVVDKVLQPPSNPTLLCIMVGEGIRVLGTAFFTTTFGALGCMPPVLRGSLVTGGVLSYMILSVVAGYVAVRTWRSISGENEQWVSISLKVACIFPGIAFLVLSALNYMLQVNNSTRSMSFSTLVALVLFFFGITIPLSLVGGLIVAKSETSEKTNCPNDTNRVPVKIRHWKYPNRLLVVVGGTLPFGVLFVEVFFILSSIWLGRFYYHFGFLLIVLFLLVVTCSQTSIVVTYLVMSSTRTMKWWWNSFFGSAFSGIYVLAYSVNYLVVDLRGLSGVASATLYLGFSSLIALSVLLATGAVGFLSSMWFVNYLVSSSKMDPMASIEVGSATKNVA